VSGDLMRIADCWEMERSAQQGFRPSTMIDMTRLKSSEQSVLTQHRLRLQWRGRSLHAAECGLTKIRVPHQKMCLVFRVEEE
jgi:hypothetical protein